MDLEAFADALADMLDRVPPSLLRDLNGGVGVSARVRRRRDDPPGTYILGEYITDPNLGRLVLLYHGSFARLFEGRPEAVWRRQMWDTLRHELRHHVEGLAGVDDLVLQDVRDLARMREEARERPTRREGPTPPGTAPR